MKRASSKMFQKIVEVLGRLFRCENIMKFERTRLKKTQLQILGKYVRREVVGSNETGKRVKRSERRADTRKACWREGYSRYSKIISPSLNNFQNASRSIGKVHSTRGSTRDSETDKRVSSEARKSLLLLEKHVERESILKSPCPHLLPSTLRCGCPIPHQSERWQVCLERVERLSTLTNGRVDARGGNARAEYFRQPPRKRALLILQPIKTNFLTPRNATFSQPLVRIRVFIQL